MAYEDRKLYALKNLNSKAEKAVDVLHAKYHAERDKEKRKPVQKQMDLVYMTFHKARARIMGLKRDEE